MSLKDNLKSKGAKAPAKPEPLWKGPLVDGITQSMLSRFLVCRERFRITYLEGLRPAPTWDHKSGYGDMWHVCEEALAAGQQPTNKVDQWTPLTNYCRNLCKQHPNQAEKIEHWYNVCKVQFPVYVDYWRKHPDMVARQPLLQEKVFEVPYKLPSGRMVLLRGKWDSVDFVDSKTNPGIWLMENKTKGDIYEAKLQRQLTFDLQTMLYLVALLQGEHIGSPLIPYGLRGVRYNVVRRPLSGGKGSIVQHKPSKSNPAGETKQHYYQRLQDIIAEDPGYFFMRWNVDIVPSDIRNFQHRFLDPILEQLCDWWEWISACHQLGRSPFDQTDTWHGIHWQHPFGVYNVLDEGGSSDLDEYILTGNRTGLVRMDKLFSELA